MGDRTKLESALAMAEAGFRVFPLAEGTKVPPKGFPWKARATVIPAEVRKLWGEYPNANVGVAMGNGIIGVDVDVKEGKPGLASLANIHMIHEPDPTFEVATPSGGRHLYFRCEAALPNLVDTVDGFPGIDIRADGGYVVGPGSTVDGGAYVALSGDPEALARLPQSLADVFASGRGPRSAKTEAPLIDLDQAKNIERAKEYLLHRAPEAIEGAGGDDATYRVATRCRDYGLSEGVALELMLEHWNETKASPPWMPDELSAKVSNAFQYASGGWGAATAEAEFEALDIDVGESPFEQKAKELADIRAGQHPAHLMSYADMIAMDEQEWLVDGVIPASAAALMFGKSNTFKSFLAIDMALSVAAGRHWHGRTVKGPANVIYVATEGANGVGRKRIPGWYDHHEVDANRRGKLWLRVKPPLIDAKEHVDALVAEMKLVGGVSLVVLDIFGGTTEGSDTEDTTARKWVDGVQRIIRETGATVLVVAHTSWSDATRSRGHTHFWGSYDTRLQVEGDKAKLTSVLTVERHKDADSLGKWPFRLEPSYGTLVPVLETNSGDEQRFTEQEKRMLGALETAVRESGTTIAGQGHPRGPGVTKAEWFEACRRAGVVHTSNEKSRTSRLDTLRRDLIRKEAIREIDGNVWPSGFEEEER